MDYKVGDAVSVKIDPVPDRDFEGLEMQGKVCAVQRQPNNPTDQVLFQVEDKDGNKVFCRKDQLTKSGGTL